MEKSVDEIIKTPEAKEETESTTEVEKNNEAQDDGPPIENPEVEDLSAPTVKSP